MPNIFDLELVSTSINDALRANREGNAARRAEALNTAFSVLKGAQTAAQTRETIGRESRAAEGFPTELGIRKEERKQAGQKTTLGAIDMRTAEREEEEELETLAAFARLLVKDKLSLAEFRALQRKTTGEEAIAKAEAGAVEARTAVQLAPTAARAKRSQLETSIKQDRVTQRTADELINANIPQIQAETQAAVLKLEPDRIQSLIDLNRAKLQVATADVKGIESLRSLALANDWSNEEFDKWAFLQGKIELVEDDIARRQDLYQSLSRVQLSTGDKFEQLIAVSRGTGNALDLLPSNVQKEEAERILTEQIIAQDDLIVRIFPEWAEIANKALLESQRAFGVEPSAKDIQRRKPLTPGAKRTTPQQEQRGRRPKEPIKTEKLTQDQIREKAAEFNRAQGK
jgi:hypothetical protein